MLKVEQTAIHSKTDVDAVWQVVFWLIQHDAEEDGKQCGGQDASLLDNLEMEKLPSSNPLCII